MNLELQSANVKRFAYCPLVDIIGLASKLHNWRNPFNSFISCSEVMITCALAE